MESSGNFSNAIFQKSQCLWDGYRVTVSTVLLCVVRGLHHSVDLRTQTYTEPVPLKYGNLARKYP